VRNEDDGDVDLPPNLQKMRLHPAAGLGVERADGSSIKRMRGWFASARTIATRLASSPRRVGADTLGEFFEADELQPLQRLALGLVAFEPLITSPNITFRLTRQPRNSV